MVRKQSFLAVVAFLLAGVLIGVFAIFSIGLALGVCLLGLLMLLGCSTPGLFAVMIALFLPFYLEWDMQSPSGMKVGATSLLVASTFIGVSIYFFLHHKNRLPRIPHLAPWMLLSGLMCAAYIHGPYFVPDAAKTPWHLYRAVLRWLFIYPLLLIVFRIEGEATVRNVILAVLVSTGLMALVGIGQTVLNAPWHPLHFGIGLKMLTDRMDTLQSESTVGLLRAFGSFAHPNGLAGFLVVVASISLGIVLVGQKDLLWYAALISGAFQIVALVCTMSRGGWIAFTSSFLIMCALARKQRVVMIGGAVFLLLGLAMAMPSARALVSRAASLRGGSQVGELMFREQRWESFLAIARANPLLGTGEASLDDPEEDKAEWGKTPHNLYLFFAVKYGVPALLLLVYLWGRIICNSIRSFQLSTLSFQKAVALGVAGSAIGLCIHGFVDVLIDTDQIWTAFWILFAMAVVLKEWTERGRLGIMSEVHE